MPSTTGRNLDFFTRTIQEISKVVCKKTLSEMHTFITAYAYEKRALKQASAVQKGLRVVGVLHNRVF